MRRPTATPVSCSARAVSSLTGGSRGVKSSNDADGSSRVGDRDCHDAAEAEAAGVHRAGVHGLVGEVGHPDQLVVAQGAAGNPVPRGEAELARGLLELDRVRRAVVPHRRRREGAVLGEPDDAELPPVGRAEELHHLAEVVDQRGLVAEDAGERELDDLADGRGGGGR